MEINIKKKKKPVWPWILAVLLILAILFVLYTQFGDEVEEQINNETNETSFVEPIGDVQMDEIKPQDDIAYYDEVKQFITYIEYNEKDLNQNYTEKATSYLALALNKMVDLEHTGDVAIEAKRDELMLSLDNLKKETNSFQQDELLGIAFTQAAELMSAMQKKDYPDLQLQVQNIERMAKSIHPDVVLTDKQNHVKEFFLLSKVALKAISEIDTF